MRNKLSLRLMPGTPVYTKINEISVLTRGRILRLVKSIDEKERGRSSGCKCVSAHPKVHRSPRYDLKVSKIRLSSEWNRKGKGNKCMYTHKTTPSFHSWTSGRSIPSHRSTAPEFWM